MIFSKKLPATDRYVNIFVKAILVLGLVTGTVCTHAQNGSPTLPYYRHFDIRNSLTTNEVYFSYQDKEKLLWFSTDNGIVKFDGYSFKTYGVQDGLCFNVVFGCGEDKNGELWFYTYSGELVRYNREKDVFECPSFNYSLSRHVKGKVIKAISFYKDTIYLSANSAVYKVFNYNKAAGITEESITDNGIVLFVPEPGKVIPYFNVHSDEKHLTIRMKGIVHDSIKTVLSKTANTRRQYDFSSTMVNGKVHLFFSDQHFLYNTQTRQYRLTKTPFQCTPGLTLAGDDILIGSYHKGLWRVSKTSGNESGYEQLFGGVSISSVAIDYQGGTWGTSQENGIYYFPNINTVKFFDVSEIGAVSKKIETLLVKNGSIFVSTYNGSVYKVSLTDKRYDIRTIIPGDGEVTTLLSSDSNLIVKRRSIAYIYTFNKNGFRSKGNINIPEFCSIPAVKKTECSSVVADLCSGYLIDSEIRNTKLPDSLIVGRNKISVYAENSLLYFSNLAHLFTYDTSKKGVHKIDTGPNTSPLNVKSIYPLNGDTVIVCTGRGVYCIAKNNVFRKITTKDGLSSNLTTSVAKSGNILFVSSVKGIDGVVNFDKEPSTFSLTRFAGVEHTPILHLGVYDNYLLASTHNGIFMFNEQIINEAILSKCNSIFKVSINGSEYSADTQSISVPYKTGIIISILNQNYRVWGSQHFRYRIERDNLSEWNYTSENKIVLNSLSPGAYNIAIESLCEHGKWAKISRGVRLSVLPPFWLSWQFITAAAFLFLAIVFTIVYLRIKYLKKIAGLKLKLSEAKFTALSTQLNPHFVFNALNSVIAFIAKNEKKAAIRFLGQFSRLMRIIFNNSQHPFISIADEVRAITHYLDVELVRKNFGFEYTITIDPAIELQHTKMPALLLQPIVENAIRHGIPETSQKGRIEVTFSKNNNNIIIEVYNNGTSFAPQNNNVTDHKGNKHSLQIIRDRLEALSAFYEKKFDVCFENLKKNTEISGAKVLIVIPTDITDPPQDIL